MRICEFTSKGLRAKRIDGYELVYSPEWEARIYLTGLHDFDIWRDLPKLEVPTLFIRGAETDTFLENAAKLVKRKQPKARVETLDKSTHLLPLERPQEVFDHAIILNLSSLTPEGGSMNEIKYSSAELMIINAARLLRDGDVVFVGVGQPNLACNLAKRTHAPNLVMIYEAGVIGAEPARLPLSIGDPTLVSGSLSVVSMYDIFANYLQRGNVDVGFMGGAQIDKYGNINATVIGGYDHPKVRLPGSGGSQEIAAWANRCYIMTPHQKRRFPEKVEFMTSAGFIGGKGDREKAGLRGGGMLAVVTDIGILEPDETAK